jgi:hypothetical protein
MQALQPTHPCPLLLLGALLAAAARAQDQPAFEPARVRWTLQAEPSLWYMGAGGDIMLPGGPAKQRVSKLGLDTPALTPFGEVHALFDKRHRLTFRGYSYSSQREYEAGFDGTLGGINFAADSPLRSSLDFATFEVEYGYAVKRYTSSDPIDAGDARARLDVLAGLRVIDFTYDIDYLGPGIPEAVFSAGYDATVLEGLVGARFEMEFVDKFMVDLTVSMGVGIAGGATSFSPDIIAGGHWRPNPNLGVSIGYRSQFFSLENTDDGFLYEGAQQGLMIGVVLKF